MHSTRITHPSPSRDIIEDGQSASEFIHVELPGKKKSQVFMLCVLLLSENLLLFGASTVALLQVQPASRFLE